MYVKFSRLATVYLTETGLIPVPCPPLIEVAAFTVGAVSGDFFITVISDSTKGLEYTLECTRKLVVEFWNKTILRDFGSLLLSVQKRTFSNIFIPVISLFLENSNIPSVSTSIGSTIFSDWLKRATTEASSEAINQYILSLKVSSTLPIQVALVNAGIYSLACHVLNVSVEGL